MEMLFALKRHRLKVVIISHSSELYEINAQKGLFEILVYYEQVSAKIWIFEYAVFRDIFSFI